MTKEQAQQALEIVFEEMSPVTDIPYIKLSQCPPAWGINVWVEKIDLHPVEGSPNYSRKFRVHDGESKSTACSTDFSVKMPWEEEVSDGHS